MDLTIQIKKLHKKLKKYKHVFIMGHMGLDLDAIASCLAFSEIVKTRGRKPYIVMNEKIHEAGVSKILDNVRDKYSIISGEEAEQLITNKDLLVLVDVNKASILQDTNLVDYFQNIFIVDHHEKGKDSVLGTLELIDNNTSSASEIITKYLYFYDIIVPNYIATTLLSGIVLDTNNFTVKTSSTTYLCAHYLMEMGADNKEVQYLLKQDLEEYILRQKIVTDTEVIKKTIAIAVGSQKIKYKKEEIAKVADTLLEFNHIELSFVIAKLDDNVIGISGRSSGKVSVGKILEQLGGGGDTYEAASRIEDSTLKEVEEQLKKVI